MPLQVGYVLALSLCLSACATPKLSDADRARLDAAIVAAEAKVATLMEARRRGLHAAVA